MNIIRTHKKSHLFVEEQKGVTLCRFADFQKEEWLNHCFTTRSGGVSTGCFSSMNLGFGRGDADAAVKENYRRLSQAMEIDAAKIVLSHQTHTTNVRLVKAEDAGKGIVRERDYTDVDGLITDIPGLVLMTFYADCVPLYFADRKHHAIGLSHSGWRGTVNRMGEKTAAAMKEAFGTQPEDLLCGIGPSICGDCFEVGPEVKEAFEMAFTGRVSARFIKSGVGDRSFIDLWQANRQVLLEAGVLPENILLPDLCTRCNPELFFSHRIMGNQRGNLAALLTIRER